MGQRVMAGRAGQPAARVNPNLEKCKVGSHTTVDTACVSAVIVDPFLR